jgi:4-hydroxy-tetrahydrodipicolinate reductase
MKIAIAGCAGRMGHVLIKKTLASQLVKLSGGSVRLGSKLIGQEVGSLVQIPTHNVLLTADIVEIFNNSDAVIDFTNPAYSLELAKEAAKQQKILVCGTTGLDSEAMEQLTQYAKQATIVCSANMSIGVNLLLGLVEKIASVLNAEECDIEIDEMHHKFKIDAPSGTALMLGKAAAKGRGVKLEDVKTDYHNAMGARKNGAIGFSVRRGGDVIGEHTVTFACAGERIEVAHKSSNRDIYASGAVKAALWAKNKQAGLYNMRDVLGV